MPNKVKEIRKKKGISQIDLARAAGISQPAISAIERETDPATPDVRIALRIAAYLKTTVENLFTE